MCGIYCIENLTNGKKYIGQSVNIKRRLSVHKTLLKNGKHDNEFLQRAWNKYGADNFNFYTLVECDISELDTLETYYINLHNTTDDSNGYNHESGGHINKTLSEDTKIKIGKANKGHRHTSETKAKMSKRRMGHEVSEETRRKISESEKGKAVSEGVKRRLSEVNTGKILSDKTKNKISQSTRGKPKSEEHRRHIKENHAKGYRVFSPELNEVFDCINYVEEKYGISHQNISKCLNGARKSAGKHPVTGEKLTWVKLENN
jgi:group I intron endonuclease